MVANDKPVSNAGIRPATQFIVPLMPASQRP